MNANNWKITLLVLAGILILIVLLLKGWIITQINIGPVVVEPPPTNTPFSGQGTSTTPTLFQTPAVISTQPTDSPPSIPCGTNGLEIEGTGSCTMIGNTIEIHAIPQSELRVYAEPRDVHDFSIDVKIKLIQIGNNAQYGLIARLSDNCQFYLLLVTPSENKLELKKYICNEGGYTTLNSSNFSFDPYSEHTLKLNVTGGEGVLIIASVNNNEMFRFIDRDNIVWRGDAGLVVEDAVVQSSLPIISP